MSEKIIYQEYTGEKNDIWVSALLALAAGQHTSMNL